MCLPDSNIRTILTGMVGAVHQWFCEVCRIYQLQMRSSALLPKDLVVVHSHCKESLNDRGSAVIDILARKTSLSTPGCHAGKQAPRNSNTMF
jgi:hypothetical protein